MDKNVRIEDYLGKEIPAEILQQLIVESRVTFPLGHTETSAISTPADNTDEQQRTKKRIDDILDHVKSMEDLLENAEDMVDELTKDMNIPPSNDSVATAAAKLNPDGNTNITRDTVDRAMSIIDNIPQLFGMGSPIDGALTGNADLEGPWLQCNEVTKDLADMFKRNLKSKSNDEPINDQKSDMADKYNKKMQNMLLEMLNMFWWNMIWAKYLVDPLFIKPLKILITPIDTIIVFFKKLRKPKKSEIDNGPLNTLLNKLRIRLLCEIPKKNYKRYQPPKEINCPPPCTKGTGFSESTKDSTDLKGVKSDMNSMFPEDAIPCITDEDDKVFPEINPGEALGLGIPPDCLEAAKTVLNALISDALTPRNPTDLGLPVRI